jgi:hypothetical protein
VGKQLNGLISIKLKPRFSIGAVHVKPYESAIKPKELQ